MWARLIGMAGRFLSARTLTVALSAVVAAGGTYVLYAIKDRGALQSQLEQVKASLKSERQHAGAWEKHAAEIRRMADRFDAYEQELQQARRDREQLARVVDDRIANIRIEFPEVQDFLARPAPAALVRVLCNDATIDPNSADCRALDSAELSGEL